MERFMRGFYAVTVVLPAAYEAVKFFIGWIEATGKEIRDNFLKAWRG